MSVFFDTNIIVYAVTQNGTKSTVAHQCLSKGGVISVQVLNEFVSVARRKLRLEWPEVQRLLSSAQTFCSQPYPVTLETHVEALQIAERYGYSIYDATIIASALLAGCDTLYSEDMQDGQQIGTVTIRNPFTAKA